MERSMSNTTELPIVSIAFEGSISLIDNLGAFGDALTKYINGLNKTPTTDEDFGALDQAVKAVHGLKIITSITSAVKAELDRCKLESNAAADCIRANLAMLQKLAKDHVFLFADTAQIVQKLPEDLTSLVKARIADHDKREADRLEAERAKAEAAERARVQAKQEAERSERERMAQAEAEGEHMTREFAASQATPLPVIESVKPSTAAHREYVNEGSQDVPAAVPAPTPNPSKPRPSDEDIIRALSLYFKATTEEEKGWIVFVEGKTL
jgi:hypothetical protein